MRRITGALIRLYPAAWRARYGVELEAVAADAPEGWRTDWDVLRGAVRMRLRGQDAFGIVIGFLAAGALLGWLGSYSMTPKYEARAVLEVAPAIVPGSVVDDRQTQEYVAQLRSEVLSRRSLAAIINDPHLNLYTRERSNMPLEDVEDQMRQEILVTINPRTGSGKIAHAVVFVVRFRHSDPEVAVQTVNALITRIIAAATSGGTGRAGYYMELLDRPVLPKRPVFPSRPAFAVAGLCAGLLLGLLTLLVRRWKTPPSAGMQAA